MTLYDPKYLITDDLLISGLNTIELFSEPILRFLPLSMDTFPSHGVDHSFKIIGLTNGFIKSWSIKLSEYELFLLYVAAWIHDIGCIRDREKHEEVSFEIFNSNDMVKVFIDNINPKSSFFLKNLLYSHRNRYDISIVPVEEEGVKLQFICAIFRLMDALEVSSSKCPSIVYKEIKARLEEKKDARAIEWWEGHMNIESISFKVPLIYIEVSIIDKSRFILDKINEEIASIADVFSSNNLPVPKIVPKHTPDI